ncbi:hypothetical protein Tco_0772384 [Tanacetum coccineum]|uniref:Uncharacterized protein n=1 Tax=Tanacetum coccineum TaxID=301880 RepID=A0ABQ4ZLK1_9ASTR
MRILSVVRIEVFSMYGYNYMKKIILRRADLKEYVIAERDFKYMYPSDFEDLYLLNLQGHLNHLSPDDKKTQLNLTKPRWDATGFEFKHDYTVIDSPRAVIFKDRYGIDKALGTMSQRVQSQQDKSRDEYKILDTERRCQKQGVHVRYPERAKDTTYLPESGELCKYGDFDGYTSDDPILQLEICRRCRLKRIYLITGSSYGGNGLPRSVKSLPQPPCSHLMFSIKDNMTT